MKLTLSVLTTDGLIARERCRFSRDGMQVPLPLSSLPALAGATHEAASSSVEITAEIPTFRIVQDPWIHNLSDNWRTELTEVITRDPIFILSSEPQLERSSRLHEARDRYQSPKVQEWCASRGADWQRWLQGKGPAAQGKLTRTSNHYH